MQLLWLALCWTVAWGKLPSFKTAKRPERSLTEQVANIKHFEKIKTVVLDHLITQSTAFGQAMKAIEGRGLGYTEEDMAVAGYFQFTQISYSEVMSHLSLQFTNGYPSKKQFGMYVDGFTQGQVNEFRSYIDGLESIDGIAEKLGDVNFKELGLNVGSYKSSFELILGEYAARFGSEDNKLTKTFTQRLDQDRIDKAIGSFATFNLITKKPAYQELVAYIVDKSFWDIVEEYGFDGSTTPEEFVYAIFVTAQGIFDDVEKIYKAYAEEGEAPHDWDQDKINEYLKDQGGKKSVVATFVTQLSTDKRLAILARRLEGAIRDSHEL